MKTAWAYRFAKERLSIDLEHRVCPALRRRKDAACCYRPGTLKPGFIGSRWVGQLWWTRQRTTKPAHLPAHGESATRTAAQQENTCTLSITLRFRRDARR